jgi:Mg2+/citrate symporter
VGKFRAGEPQTERADSLLAVVDAHLGPYRTIVVQLAASLATFVHMSDSFLVNLACRMQKTKAIGAIQ